MNLKKGKVWANKHKKDDTEGRVYNGIVVSDKFIVYPRPVVYLIKDASIVIYESIGKFHSQYASRVVNYESKLFLRLAAGHGHWLWHC